MYFSFHHGFRLWWGASGPPTHSKNGQIPHSKVSPSSPNLFPPHKSFNPSPFCYPKWGIKICKKVIKSLKKRSHLILRPFLPVACVFTNDSSWPWKPVSDRKFLSPSQWNVKTPTKGGDSSLCPCWPALNGKPWLLIPIIILLHLMMQIFKILKF